MTSESTPQSRRGSVHVITVGEGADPAGRALAEGVLSAGRALAGRETAAEVSLAMAVDRAVADPEIGAILVCGGQGLDAGDPALGVVSGRLTTALPGFAQLFRVIAFHEHGAVAMLARVDGGLVGDTALFALPGDLEAARLAWSRLVLPNLDRLRPFAADAPEAEADEVDPGDAAPSSEPTPEEPRFEGGVHVETMGQGQAPPTEEEVPASGWRGGLAALRALVDREVWPQLPEQFDRLAPVRDVIESAGERAEVRLPDGTRYIACGFPDLLRDMSKVLLVRAGDPLAEVIALHRHPRRVGVVVHDDADALDVDRYLPSADLDPNPIAEQRTGRRLPTPGTLFAVDQGEVYVVRNRVVWRWDGRRETQEGSPTQVLASLMLRWSGR